MRYEKVHYQKLVRFMLYPLTAICNSILDYISHKQKHPSHWQGCFTIHTLSTVLDLTRYYTKCYTHYMIKHKDGFLREDKSEKVDYTLIPTNVWTALAKHYTEGAKKHGIDNWKKSTDMQTFKQSAFRHLIAILEDKTDEDHYSDCVWNINCLKWNKLK